jgi:hypothetical protein
MKSYILLEEIKNKYLIDFSDENALKILNENIDKISTALVEDFKTITNEILVIDDVIIYYDDECFKQGSTAYFVKAKFQKDSQYSLSIECLVDSNKIGVKSKTEPNESSFINFHNSIVSKNNQEGFTELNKLLN